MFRFFVFSLIFLLVSPLFAVNSDFEKRMHDVYKSSYSVEVPDQDWVNYVEKIEDNTYQVKAGDTLWGLSKVFFGDGFFWSKIWSYNSALTNPHLLSVGAEISFFSGSVEMPPSMDVNGENVNKGTINITRTSDGPSDLYPNAPHLPESTQDVTPVLNEIPPAFLAKQNYAGSNKFDKQGMSFDIRPPVRVNPLFVVHAFLYDGSASSYPRVGDIFEAEDGNISMGTSSQFYFESENSFKVGDTVTVMGKDFDFSNMGVSGDVIYYMGKAVVTDVMTEGRYRAEIQSANVPVTPKGWVSSEEIPALTDDREGRPNDASITVAGGTIENDRAIFGDGATIFLDGGADQGLRKGDVMGVYKVRKYRYRNYDVEVSPTPIAHIKIFRADRDVASAFVIDSKEAIVPGDKTGPPESVTGTMTQSEQIDLDSFEDDLELDGSDLEGSFDEGPSLEDELEGF